MRAHVNSKTLLATMAVLVVALVGPMTAGASNRYIPGVTDSTTGILAERNDRYIPGVTDSTTGVLRDLERRDAERHDVVVPARKADDSGFRYDATVAAGAALAAMVALAVLALLAGARRRRVAI